MIVDDIQPGIYKTRLRSRGPWVPVRVWIEDGDRCEETGELLSDQIYRAEWSPRTNSGKWVRINPWDFLNRLRPIDKEELEWMMLLKNLK